MITLESLRDLLTTSELPALGPGPRPGTEPQKTLNQKLDEKLKGADLDSDRQDLIRALILLWHDHLDAAHQIAQRIEGPDGALVHGIMHRREPDYANAAYWFRRVGNHPAYAELGKRAGELLDSEKEAVLRKELLSKGEWNAFGFINACERAARNPGDSSVNSLRQIQQWETEVMIVWLCRA